MARHRALAVRQANFISSVSHELRAPIAGVQLLAEGLESGRDSTPAERHEFAQLIGRECRRLAALIENVLDLGRIERGQKRYDFEPLDLRALVVETGALMQSLARQGGVRLAVHTPELGVECEMTGDGGALQQALTNLIDNALKHAPAGSVVDVALKASPPGRFRIEVTDAGPGVPEESRQRIFEPFQRLENELRRSTTGIGIGLTLARHAVHAHGGTIGVETANSGGARFVIEVPAEAEAKEVS
jgi:signal transduction histidine kinase